MSRKAAATAPATQPQEIPAHLRARNKPGSISDQLKVEYLKPSALAEMGRFNITGAYLRKGNLGDECAYEIQIVEPGENQGASATLTLKDTPVRRKMVDIVKRAGSVGPYVLKQVGNKGPREQWPWAFVDPDAPENGALGGDEEVPF